MPNILLVEDDKDLAWTLEQLLCVDGYEVRVVSNGEEALRFLVQKLPDLVITDIEMPILDGEGLAYRMIIEDCGKEKIPIVIVSGFPELGNVAKRIGTPYFISKPYNLESLLTLINRALVERIPPKNPEIKTASYQ